MVVGPLYRIAESVIALISPQDEPATLHDHLDRKLSDIQELCTGSFGRWMGVLNVIQQWYMTGHKSFADIHHVIVLGKSWEGERDDAVQDCMEPDLWKGWKSKTQQAPDDLLPAARCHC